MKAKKGTISVQNREGMIRLRLPRSWYNKVVYLSLGIPDTPENKLIAVAKKGIMESDYIYGRFDFSLDKYRFESVPPEEPKIQQLSLLEIFIQYMNFKSKALKPSSMKNLITVRGKLKNMPDNVLKSANNIKAWLVEQNSQEQARRCLMQLKACCDWAVEQNLIHENPFADLKRLKRVYEHNPNPFTKNERDLIIQVFKDLKPHYFNFVKFLFFTGCRPSEAAALKWENVYIDEKYLIFCESLVEGYWSNNLKTQSSRRFPINDQVNEIFLNQDKLFPTVFFGEKGKPINLHNFANKVWSPLLKNLPIKKRGCYHCRHTFITLCLDANIPIQQVAAWVGNSPEIILQHYAGLTKNEVPLL